MYDKIYGSLSRQLKALELLKALMEEEFSLLVSNQVDQITSLEFSIHELLRQLADEKEKVIASLGGGRVMNYSEMLPEEQKEALQKIYKEVDRAEQACARRAHMNTEVSLSLLKQGEGLLKELTKAVTPKAPKSYSRQGAYTKAARPDAVLISGRL